MSQIIEVTEKAIAATVTELGYEIVDIEYVKKYEQMNLTVFIDTINPPGNVTLDDCEKVHNVINPILDDTDPTNGKPYVLNVSSPGLDRPFKKQRDFERNYEKEIEIKLYAPLKGKKIIEGVLKSRDENCLTVETKNGELKLENSKIAKVSPLIKFE